MPDLTGVSPLADNYKKHSLSQSDVGRELIVKIVIQFSYVCKAQVILL